MPEAVTSSPDAPKTAPPLWRDRPLLLVLLLAALILLPRGIMIAASQSQRIDDAYHMVRGMKFLHHGLTDALPLNDPPLGEAISAIPLLWLTFFSHLDRHHAIDVFSGLIVSRQHVFVILAIWKTLIFLPAVALIFIWLRNLYGSRSAWLGAALLCFEPTFAAHIPLPTLDVLGVEGILFGCYFCWRYFQKPSTVRLILAAVFIAFALLIKHTTIVLPGIALLFAFLCWIVRPILAHQRLATWTAQLKSRITHIILAMACTVLAMWVLMMFDFSKPRLPELPVASTMPSFQQTHPQLASLFSHRWPMGLYIGSVLEARSHNEEGHRSFLFGEFSQTGFWYYFPALATFKIPLGVALLLLLGLLSIFWIRPRWDEWALFLPMIAWTGFMLSTRINIGFRHFLPAYVWMLLLSTRILAQSKPTDSHPWVFDRAITLLVWLSLLATAISGLAFHPDYISYVNFPRHKVWWQIDDLDWGQGLVQTRKWIDANAHGRPVAVWYFGPRKTGVIRSYLDSKTRTVTLLTAESEKIEGMTTEKPTHGLLIISAVYEPGAHRHDLSYAVLRPYEPIALIGHCMLVYDLDALSNGKGFEWEPRRAHHNVEPPTTNTTQPAQ